MGKMGFRMTVLGRKPNPIAEESRPVTDHTALPDASPPEDYRSLAAEYPWLAMAAGAGLGLLAGALLPKRAGRRLGQRALGLAFAAGEVGLALSAKARSGTGAAGKSGLDLARSAVGALARARKG